jgi:hypothetical protein
MALQSMRFDHRRWRPTLDSRGVVHHGSPMTKKEIEYQFRLADTVRAIVPCGECGVAQGDWCVRKRDRQPMANHSYRVRQARLLFEQRVLPQLDRLCMTLCSTLQGPVHVVFGPAPHQDVDCMSCLVIASRQGG